MITLPRTPAFRLDGKRALVTGERVHRPYLGVPEPA